MTGSRRLTAEYWYGPDLILWSPTGHDVRPLVEALPRSSWHRSKTRSGGYVVPRGDALALLEVARSDGWRSHLIEHGEQVAAR